MGFLLGLGSNILDLGFRVQDIGFIVWVKRLLLRVSGVTFFGVVI